MDKSDLKNNVFGTQFFGKLCSATSKNGRKSNTTNTNTNTSLKKGKKKTSVKTKSLKN
jgi:hypothetical protein